MSETYYTARSVDDVLSAWKAATDARICAGGTDILVRLKDALSSPPLIDISRIPALQGITKENGATRLGACVTYTDIERSTDIPASAQALTDAVRIVGSPQIRNRGTVGGNIMNASPAGDTLPPLIALDASITCVTASGEHTYSLDSFFTGPGTTQEGEQCLLTHVTLPENREWISCFVRLGQRQALAISKVSLACAVLCEKGVVTDIRCALGAVAPTIIRATSAEDSLTGVRLDNDVPDDSVDAIQRDAAPISDIRSTDVYRRRMCGSLLRRAWHILGKRADMHTGEDPL